MTDDITIDYSLDPSGYLAGAQQLSQANVGLQQSFGSMLTTGGLVSKAMDAITPKRAALAGWGAMAQQAANTEQAMSTLAGQATLTGTNVDKLTGTINRFARTMPLGAAATRATVMQLSQMGVTGEGTESKVAKLTKTISQLSGATGEGPAQLAQGMTDLARATGNTNLDPTRFTRLADSVTTLSAKSGASASSILAFSKNIAPMAQSAGIGATGVLGISSAFARLGEDGIGASTAVNKMLTDMSKAVREGGPELKTYAQITGQTVDQFTKLAKANPTEALTQVTESIAKAGQSGPRLLEQLGLDGPRTQRSLQALASSGGLRPSIAQAADAYNSGSTQQAADKAFGGLNDSVTELTSSSQQLAEAFGAPLLGPLTAFTNALKIPVNLALSAVSSTPAQKALEIGAVGGTALLGAKALMGLAGPLMLALGGRQALTSGPLASLIGGYSKASVAPEGETTMGQRYGARAIALEREGKLGTTGPIGPLNQRAFTFGQSFRDGREKAMAAQMGPEAYAARQAAMAAGSTGPSFRQRLGTAARTGWNYANTGMTAVQNQTAEAARNSRVPFDQRTSSMGLGASGTAYSGAYDAARAGGAGRVGAFRAGMGAFNETTMGRGGGPATFGQVGAAGRTAAAGVYSEARAAGASVTSAAATSARAFNTGLTDASKSLTGFRGTMASTARAVTEMGAASASAARGVGGGLGIGSKLGSIAGGLAPLAIIGGGIAAAGAITSHQADIKQANADLLASDVSSSLNAYRESIGKATVAVQSIGSIGTNLAATMAKNTVTFDDAKTVTDADISAAAQTKDKVVNRYIQSDAKGLAAQVATQNAGGFAPDELKAAGVDMLRQNISPEMVRQVMAMLPASALASPDSATGQPAPVTALSRDDITNAVTAVANDPKAQGTSWERLGQRFSNIAGYGQGDASMPTAGDHRALGYETIGKVFGVGGGANASTVTDDQNKAGQQMLANFQKTFGSQSNAYSPGYAQQQQMESMQTAIAAAVKTGNNDYANNLMHQFAAALGAGDKGQNLTVGDLANNGGNFATTLGKADEGFAKSNAALLAEQQAAGGTINPKAKAGYISDTLRGVGAGTFADAFDLRSTSSMATTVQSAVTNVGDVGKLQSAVDALTGSAEDGGKGMASFATEAMNAASALSPTGPEIAIVLGTIQKAQQRLTSSSMSMSSGQAFGAQYRFTSALANAAPSDNPAVDAIRMSAISQQQDLTQQARGRLVARLQTQRSFDLSTSRGTQDNTTSVGYARDDYSTARKRTVDAFNLQMSRGNDDYHRSVGRSNEDFQRGQARSEEDYHLSLARSQQDFNIQRVRQQRDFATSMKRETQDYQTSTARSLRDFNLSMARQMEDAAKTVYDPYSRIQTKATWDAKNLLANLGEQAVALKKQMDNLDALRKAGVSTSTISMLGLADASNAQQTANLAGDISTDPKIAAQLNAAAKQRQALTTGLMNDPSNTSTQRARDDFAKSLADQNADRAKAVTRAKEDLNRSMSDQANDYERSLERGAADFSKSLMRSSDDYARNLARNDEDFRRSVDRAGADLQLGLKNNEIDYTKSMDRQRAAFLLQIKRMKEDIALADTEIGGSMTALATAVDKAIHGQAVDWSKLTMNGTKDFLAALKGTLVPAIRVIASDLGLDFSGVSAPGAVGQTAQGYANHRAGMDAAARADGGTIPGSSPHDRADNILIRATAGEFMQPVATVKHYGDVAMEAIRSRRVPKEALEGYADGGKVWPTNTRTLSPSYPGHSGVDIAAGMGAPIYAPLPGKIVYSGWDHGYGQAIFEQFASGLQAVFGHTSKVIAGQGNVAAGQLIGLVGSTGHSTGPHLHFEVNSPGPFGNSADRATSMAFLNGLTTNASMAGAVSGGTSMSANGTVDLSAAVNKLDQKRGGWYGALREAWRAKLKDYPVSGSAVANLSGDPGAHGANAMHNQSLAQKLLSSYSWGGSEMSALTKLWNGESGWNEFANNPSSGAYGIPQSLPGSKMASVGNDWRTNPETQIRWGMNYIRDRYGSPSKALSTWNSRFPHWYDKGGVMAPGAGSHINATGKPEAVLTNEQWSGVAKLAEEVGIMVSREQGRSMRASEAGGLTVHHHDERITYDYRNDFGNANITVQAQDPDEMARKLDAKKRRFTAVASPVGAR